MLRMVGIVYNLNRLVGVVDLEYWEFFRRMYFRNVKC